MIRIMIIRCHISGALWESCMIRHKVDIEDLEREGYNIFLDEKYKGDVYLYDSERDSFMMALKALGYSMNTENEAGAAGGL